MPGREVWKDGQIVESHYLTPQEEAAELDASKGTQIDAMDVAVFRALHRHENLIRALIRTIRTNSTLNTRANSNGLPSSATSPDLTLAEAREAFKSLLPD